jgi:hypothetical protein
MESNRDKRADFARDLELEAATAIRNGATMYSLGKNLAEALSSSRRDVGCLWQELEASEDEMAREELLGKIIGMLAQSPVFKKPG